MATLGLVEYEQASPEVQAVYDDIMATRKTGSREQLLESHCPRSGHAAPHLAECEGDHGPGGLGRAHQRNDLRGRQRHQSVQLLHRIAHGRGPQGRHDRFHVC